MTGEASIASISKNALVALLGSATAYYPSFSKVLGDACAGIFVSRIFYWTNKGGDPDGWIHKTQEQIEEETGLTLRNQQTARRKAREMGVMEETLKGVPAKMHYRVNLDKLSALLNEDQRKRWRDTATAATHLQSYRSSLSESDEQVCANPSLSDSDKLVYPNQTNKFDQFRQTGSSESDKPLNTMVTTIDTTVVTTGGDLSIQDHPATQPVALPPPLTDPSATIKSLPNAATTAPTAATAPIPVASPTPPVAPPLPAPAPARQAPGVLAATTSDPLINQAIARFNGQWGNREQHHLDELQKQVQSLGLTPAAFRQLVDACLGKYGMTAVAALNTDEGVRALTRAQTTMLAICAIDERFRSTEGLESIFSSWRENDYRGASLPNSTQLIEHAGKMKAGAVSPEPKKGQTPHANQNAQHRNSSGRPEQPARPAGPTPDFSRYNRNKANRQPTAGA